MNEEKKKQDTSDVDSDEHSQGKEIETGEENLPSKAAAVHEVIRMEGEKELDRDGQALLWSAIAAGLSISASLMAKGILHARQAAAGQPVALVLFVPLRQFQVDQGHAHASAGRQGLRLLGAFQVKVFRTAEGAEIHRGQVALLLGIKQDLPAGVHPLHVLPALARGIHVDKAGLAVQLDHQKHQVQQIQLRLSLQRHRVVGQPAVADVRPPEMIGGLTVDRCVV